VTTQTQNTESASVRIVRGEPSPEELAALVAVLAARAAAGAGNGEAAPTPVSGWTDRARYVRSGRVEFGARAGWRSSALPR
jgi:hypothetical protein